MTDTNLTMPKLSDSMADAVIVRWLKAPGESFARGDALIEVETDKATVVYEAEADGTLDAILVPEGKAAAVGDPIATLANGAAPAAREAPAPARKHSEPQRSDGKRPNATPVARRTAADLGVALHDVEGTGPAGRITREDVQRAAEAEAPAQRSTAATGKGDVRVLELTATQATIARRMVESATTIPVFTVSADMDVALVAALRKDVEGAPSLNDFVVKATALTLREFPRFNASYADGTIECHSRVNVGIAVATDDALLVPVVHDADRKTLRDIATETRRLAHGARRRDLQQDDLRDATFTVSNLGMFRVRSFTAIIDPPQVAILAVGGVRDGVLTATLSCDHRVVYGADGARFLSRLRELLERPLELVS